MSTNIYDLDLQVIFKTLQEITILEEPKETKQQTRKSQPSDYELKKFKSMWGQYNFRKNMNKQYIVQDESKIADNYDDLQELLCEVDNNFNEWLKLDISEKQTKLIKFMETNIKENKHEKYIEMLNNGEFNKPNKVLYDYRKKTIVKLFV